MFLQDCDAFVVVREPMERMLSEFNWLKIFGVDETLRPKKLSSQRRSVGRWSTSWIFNIEIQVTLEVGVEYKESLLLFAFYFVHYFTLLHGLDMMFDVFET